MQIIHEKYTMDVKDYDYEDDYATKYKRKYHIKTFPFSLVGRDSQGYIVEAWLNGSSVNNADLSIYVIFSNLLVAIREVDDKEKVKNEMQQIAVLNTKIRLEKGQTGDETIEITSKTLGKSTFPDEIKKLEEELKNSQQKRIGF